MWEDGVAEDCDSLAHKMQSNLQHSQEVMECSDDWGGHPWFRSGRGGRELIPIGSIERDNHKIIYLMNETMWLARDNINREQKKTFLAWSGRIGGF